MPAPPDLKQLIVGQRLQDFLLVQEVDQHTYGGQDCTVLILGNCTGRIPTAPFWGDDRSSVVELAQGDVVQVIADVTMYRGRRQLKVTSLRVLPKDEIDWRQLQPSIGDATPYWEVLDGWRAEIQSPRLRHILTLFYDDEEFRIRYQECPASTLGHHAELGGLLKHTCEVAAISRAIARLCKADVELVLAGALLHDIGKLETYAWRGGLETTSSGWLLGHVVLGIVMLQRRVAEESTVPCTGQELTLLCHLIASHHGKLEFGAAVQPMTLEAEVLHYADHASAKTTSMAEALTDPSNFLGDGLVSSRTIWQLDKRRAYRGASDWGL